MSKNGDPMNPFRYKVIIKDHLIHVKMIYRSKVRKIKKEFTLLLNEWMEIERYRNTPYNIHSMMYRLLSRYIDPLFSREERLYSEYMNICMDAGKAIDKQYRANMEVVV